MPPFQAHSLRVQADLHQAPAYIPLTSASAYTQPPHHHTQILSPSLARSMATTSHVQTRIQDLLTQDQEHLCVVVSEVRTVRWSIWSHCQRDYHRLHVEVTERLSTKFCHMYDRQPDFKMCVQNLDFFPIKRGHQNCQFS